MYIGIFWSLRVNEEYFKPNSFIPIGVVYKAATVSSINTCLATIKNNFQSMYWNQTCWFWLGRKSSMYGWLVSSSTGLDTLTSSCGKHQYLYSQIGWIETRCQLDNDTSIANKVRVSVLCFYQIEIKHSVTRLGDLLWLWDSF